MGIGSSHSRTLLLEPVFLGSVGLLAINDHVLKPVFNNGLTGKISDFSGLFALTVFAIALAPRFRFFSSASIALTFAWWKSPASSSLIDFWNSLELFGIGRTQDYSDLVALSAVAAALFYVQFREEAATPGRRPSTRKIAVVSVLSLLVFSATSYRSDVTYDLTFSYEGTPAELISDLEAMPISVYSWPESDLQEIRIPSAFCFDSVTAYVKLAEGGEGTTLLHLVGITHQCATRRGEKSELLDLFEDMIAEPLGLRPVG